MITKILFVCLGNICRSPAAEGIMLHLIKEKGCSELFEIDSAGLIDYHQGELPDSRMRTHAIKRGYNLTHRARRITIDDFYNFDLILGMDNSNIDALRDLAPTVETKNKISRVSDYCVNIIADHVPDPYYGGAGSFEYVLDILEDACNGILSKKCHKLLIF